MSSRFLLAAVTLTITAMPALAAKSPAERGAEVFKKANCVMCHPGGDNAMEPKKPIRGAAFLKKYPTDAMIVKRIREGSPNGVMPAFYKDQIDDRQMTELVAYIRSLTPCSKPCPVKPAAKPPAPAKGKH